MSKPKLDLEPEYGKKVRVLRVKLGLTQPAFGKLMGFTKNTVGSVEKGGPPSPRFIQQVEMLEEQVRTRELGEKTNSGLHRDVPLGDDIVPLRRIPSVSWAQAGDAVDFEELPTSWQKLVPTDVSDPKAFAITIAGDSMEPRYHANDVATVVPSQTLRQNDLVIARIKDQGVVFKICNRVGNTYRFSSYNPAYAPFEVPIEKMVWIYPVKQVLKIVI